MSTRVRIVGAGLLGTSIGMALSGKGFEVRLVDLSPTAVALARDLGAGEVGAEDDRPELVVVATPPDVTAAVVADALAVYPHAVVTDIASLKVSILTAVQALAPEPALARYVGSHPMAGRERSGAVAAQADLFEGRSWVLCPHPATAPGSIEAVHRLATATGASVVELSALEHDAAVAAVSHVPQIAASLVAARLRDLPETAVGLAGQGLRDLTRIAASDPLLWTQILSGNAAALLPVVDALSEDLQQVRAALGQLAHAESAGAGESARGARAVLAGAISRGQLGQARIPGKHGSPALTYASLVVVLRDEPGQLARLFTDIGQAGINLEDVRIDHVNGARVGLAELSVLPAALEQLQEFLAGNGWSVHR